MLETYTHLNEFLSGVKAVCVRLCVSLNKN